MSDNDPEFRTINLFYFEEHIAVVHLIRSSPSAPSAAASIEGAASNGNNTIESALNVTHVVMWSTL